MEYICSPGSQGILYIVSNEWFSSLTLQTDQNVNCVEGNMGRTSSKWATKKYTTWLVYHFLEQRLPKHPIITWMNDHEQMVVWLFTPLCKYPQIIHTWSIITMSYVLPWLLNSIYHPRTTAINIPHIAIDVCIHIVLFPLTIIKYIPLYVYSLLWKAIPSYTTAWGKRGL